MRSTYSHSRPVRPLAILPGWEVMGGNFYCRVGQHASYSTHPSLAVQLINMGGDVGTSSCIYVNKLFYFFLVMLSEDMLYIKRKTLDTCSSITTSQ